MPAIQTIPKYHSKDLTVLVLSMLPAAVMLNYFLFGDRYFEGVLPFLLPTVSTFLYLAFAFVTYGLVAISLRNRFPSDKDFFKRLLICLGIFYLMSAAYISLLLFVYDQFSFFGYQYYDSHFVNAYICFIVINTFLTFFNEGLYRFENYRQTITETEQLKKEYMHSQLLGLKSQMNPHFLFNSLNTLSCLIQEDADKAEDFLDHMSKVYRYLLRNRDEQLVTLRTEMAFIHSYCYLLERRHGGALKVSMGLPEEVSEQMIPPLTLQMIIENSVNLNSLSRTAPLAINIRSGHKCIEVSNSVQPKFHDADEHSEVLINILNKYKLLCQQCIEVDESDGVRTIRLPLIQNREVAV